MRHHGATGFVQMGAVVKTAGAQVGAQVGHQVRQLHGFDVVEPKFLETRRVDQGGLALLVHPVPGGAGGGVLARIERARNFTGERSRMRHKPVDQGAFAHARRSEHQGAFAGQSGLQFVQPGFGGGGGFTFEAQGQYRTAHAAVGRQACPGAVKARLHVALVEHDQHVNVLGLGRDQGACELAF